MKLMSKIYHFILNLPDKMTILNLPTVLNLCDEVAFPQAKNVKTSQ